MTNLIEQLRELADALDEAMFKLRTYKRTDEAAKACERAADYLRACADAKPVGYVTANGLRSLRQDDATVLLYAHDYLIRPDHVALYTHPAPVAPQAEQPIDLDAVAMQQMRQAAAESTWMPAEYSGSDWISDVCRWLRDGPPQADIGRLRECAQRLVDGARWGLAGALSPSSKAREIPSSAWSDVKSRHLASLRDALVVPQAEPKREDRAVRDLLAIIHCDGGHHTEAVGLDQSIKDAQAAVCELKRELAMEERVPLSDKMVIACARVEITRIQPDEWVASDADLVNFARTIERKHGIGGSDE